MSCCTIPLTIQGDDAISLAIQDSAPVDLKISDSVVRDEIYVDGETLFVASPQITVGGGSNG